MFSRSFSKLIAGIFDSGFEHFVSYILIQLHLRILALEGEAKSAFIDGKRVDANGVKKFAAIPSKPELYSMLAGTLSNFTRGLAVAIKAIADKKAEAQA